MIAVTAIVILLLSLCSAAPYAKRSASKYVAMAISPEPVDMFARFCVGVKIGDEERLAVLDSGSSDFWLPSKIPCGDSFCSVDTPQGLTDLDWEYAMTYADGTTSNITMYNGTITYGEASVDSTFGIGHSEGLSAGMMGLAYPEYQVAYAKTGKKYESVPLNLRDKGAIDRASYSVSKEEIVFGGYNEGIIDPDTIVYTPFRKLFPPLNHTGNFNIILKGVDVNTYASQKDAYNPKKATSQESLLSGEDVWVTYDTGASVSFATAEYYSQLMSIFGNNTYEAVYDSTDNSTITSVPCDLFTDKATTLTLHLENGKTFEVDARSFTFSTTNVQTGDEICAVGLYELAGSARLVFGVPMTSTSPVIIDMEEEKLGFSRRRSSIGADKYVSFSSTTTCTR